MSHLRHGGGIFLLSDAYRDSQKSRKSARNGLILRHRLSEKMAKVELSTRSKVRAHVFEPTIFREQAGFAQGFLIAQGKDPGFGLFG